MKRALLGAVATLAIAPSAHAQGWSLGGSIGATEIDEFCDLFGPQVACDDTSTGYKLQLGNDVNENLRIEGFYADLGEAEATDSFGDSVTAEADGFGVSLMPMAPVSDQADVFLKAGLFNWEADATVNISGSTATGSDDGSDPFFGLGLRYRVGDQGSFRVEYEQFDLDGDDVTMFSGGWSFYF
jgi:hypothetical protein